MDQNMQQLMNTSNNASLLVSNQNNGAKKNGRQIIQ